MEIVFTTVYAGAKIINKAPLGFEIPEGGGLTMDNLFFFGSPCLDLSLLMSTSWIGTSSAFVSGDLENEIAVYT